MTNTLEIKLLLSGLAQVKAGLADLSHNLKSAMLGTAGAVAGLAGVAGIAGLGAAVGTATKRGVDFNRQLETAKVGIASILKSTNPEAFRTFGDALATSTGLVAKLQKQAMESPATFQELVAGFQAIAGAASAAGVPLQKQTDLIVVMSQALSALGIRSDQIMQESRALLTGDIDRNAMAARMLGITGADIARARQANDVYGFLMKKLSAFSEAGKIAATSYTVSLSNLQDAFEQTMGQATVGLFDNVKHAFIGISEAIKAPEVIQALTTFHDYLARVVRTMADTLPVAIRNLAAVVGVVVEEWKAGRIHELIGLTIELGFELGIEAVKVSWQSLVQFLSQGDLWRGLLNGAMSFGTSLAKLMVDLFTWPVKEVAAVMIWTFDKLRVNVNALIEVMRSLFAKMINGLAQGFENLMNPVLEFMHMAPKSFGRLSEAAGAKETALTFAESWQIAQESVEESTAAMKEFFAGSLSLAREAIGLNSDMSKSSDQLGSALARWTKLINSFKRDAAWRAGALPEAPAIPDLPGSVRKENVVAPWLTMELEAKSRLVKLEAERARIQGDFRVTEADKWKQQRAILEAESQLLEGIIGKLKEQIALSTDPAEAKKIADAIGTFEGALSQKTTQGLTLGADPSSLAQQLKASMTELRNQFGTLAQTIARTFRDVIGAAVNGVSESIGGLIRGTMAWGDALRNIGSSILNGVIDSIARMFAEWIVGRLAVKAVEVAAGSAEAAAKAPGALFSSISSWGIAAAVGAAGLIAALAAISGAFADGGRPPAGQPALVGERGPELFVPDRPGLIIPNHMLAGAAAGGSVSVEPAAVTVAVLNNDDQIRRFMESNAGRRIVFMHANALKADLGIPS